MKTKFLLFSVAICLSYTMAWAQPTSYGGLIGTTVFASPGTAGQMGSITNSYFGHQSGLNSTGSFNTFIGYRSGTNNFNGSGNVFIGHQAGFFENNSNRLYIDNSNTPTPLIFGNFSSNRVGINHNNPSYTLHVGGDMGATTFYGSGSGLTSLNASNLSSGTINNARLDADLQDLADGMLSASKVQHGTYFITSAGVNGQVWQSDGSGQGVWTTLNIDDADADVTRVC